MALAPELVQFLACPESKAPLLYFPRGERDDDEANGFLFSPASKLRYRIDEDGVPVLLVEEAERLDDQAAKALLDRAAELGITAAD